MDVHTDLPPTDEQARRGGAGDHPRWWDGAVGYEVYIRSFADSDGDGIGDLPGIRSRLPYLADLGVDIVWITPYCPSPQRDHGYDVSDYLGVDPTYGTLDDLTGLIEDAHALGLRVVADLVPNHSSDQHPWFVDSRSSRSAEHRDWYVWRDPGPDGGPPNNWLSHFGGPAWTLDGTTGQYYMHLFLPEQPDLNWASEGVQAAFRDILATWFERGIDGVRIDVAHALVEHSEYPDNPILSEAAGQPESPAEAFERLAHHHDLDQDGVLDVYRDWRAVAEPHDALLLGEVFVLDHVRLDRYVQGDGLHVAFCFDTLKVAWDADAIRTTLEPYVTASGEALAWPLSSHDDPHAATRFGGGALGARRALAYLTFLVGLPGSVFLYQGDELGLDDGELGDDIAEDPIAVRNPGASGRDPQRTPMTWEPGPGFGFTTGTPWLPFGTNRSDERTAAAQTGDPASHLERTRRLLALRRRLRPQLTTTSTEWLTDDGPVIAIARGDDVLVALHVGDGDGPAALVLPEDAVLLFASDDATTLVEGELRLAEDAAALVALSTEAAAALADDEDDATELAAARAAVAAALPADDAAASVRPPDEEDDSPAVSA
jgi:alpha-glucosidase